MSWNHFEGAFLWRFIYLFFLQDFSIFKYNVVVSLNFKNLNVFWEEKRCFETEMDERYSRWSRD